MSIGMKRCPSCNAVFNMFAKGEMVLGVDDEGVYMEHVACGFRGRSESRTLYIVVENGEVVGWGMEIDNGRDAETP